MINRASEGTCRQCGRRILWVRMKSGKNMPVDMALHNYKKDSTGKEKIVTPDGEVVTGRILVGEHGDERVIFRTSLRARSIGGRA